MIFIFVFILTSWDDENLGSFGVTKMRVRCFYVSVAAVSLKKIFVKIFCVYVSCVLFGTFSSPQLQNRSKTAKYCKAAVALRLLSKHTVELRCR